MTCSSRVAACNPPGRSSTFIAGALANGLYNGSPTSEIIQLVVGAVRQTEPGPAWLPDRQGAWRLGVVVGATALLIVLAPWLGMTPATALFLLVLLRFLEGHAWPIVLGVSVATAAANWAIFAHWLGVPFPTGVLGF